MPAPLVFFVVNAIGGTAIRFGAKKAAQEFIKKYGGKLATKSGNKKVVSSAASGVKRWVQNLLKKKVDPKVKPKGKSGQFKPNLVRKADKKTPTKDDFIAITSKIKKPGSGPTTKGGGRSGQIKKGGSGSSVTKPGTSVRNTKSGQTSRIDWSKLKNITPKPKPKSNVKPPPKKPSPKFRVGNIIKTGNILLQSELAKKVPVEFPKIDNNKVTESEAEEKGTSKKKPQIGIKPKVKIKRNVPIAVKRRTLKKKPSPIQSRKTRKGPIKKPDLSQLTGKFGVEGFSRTGSTMSDFLIGFSDGKGGKGRNYDKFMAKDSNGQYKVKSDTLKSMAKRLKEKMKK